MPPSPARRNPFCLSRSLRFRHAQLGCVALVLFCEPYDQGQVRNMSAQPDQIILLERLSFDCLTIRQCAPVFRRKRYRLSRALNKYQYQTSQRSKFEFIFHLSVYVCMYANTNQALQTRRLSRVFAADRKVHLTPARACINLGQ